MSAVPPQMMTLPEQVRVFRLEIMVQFGDCDPAGIVFYPNFYRWFDEATHAATRACGFGWQRMAQELGWLGLPLAETGAQFRRPVSPGDTLVCETRVTAVEERRILFAHRLLRDDEVVCDGFEKRFVGVRSDEDPPRVRAIEVPLDLVEALTRPDRDA